MDIEIQLTNQPIAEKISPPFGGAAGAWAEFRGIVRGEENGSPISALDYESYPEMAEREMRRLAEEISAHHPCLAVKIIHRLGVIPVGETAIYLGVAAKHRAKAFALLAKFMDRLKQDVPIWKRRALPVNSAGDDTRLPVGSEKNFESPRIVSCQSLDGAIAEIHSRCQPLPPVRVSLAKSIGRVLHETVCASEDLPANDRSARDGYTILANDCSESFQIVDTIHAADWKPRQLKPSEAVRVATGAVLPCDGVRVVMQEDVERNGGHIRIMKRDDHLNIRKRGEEVKAGQPLVKAGVRLDAGQLAVLATAGCAQPLVNPQLRVMHFTTGDEIVAPDQMPKPGQIRDSNSILIRSLLQPFQVELQQAHLPEDFALAKAEIETRNFKVSEADLVLISGGASVGDKDFTRQLLEWLGFEVVFNQVNVRPGKPLIFGVNGPRVAFGLPGNPLAHFTCFHFAVATALARMSSEAAPTFLRGRLAAKLDDTSCSRETLWPARLDWNEGSPQLHPLAWASSGDVTCLVAANVLIRVPAKIDSLEAGAELEFLPTTGMLGK